MKPSPQPPPVPQSGHRALWLALALSLGAAVSLGVTRFAYGLLLPPMRADLGWSYALAGFMNTANAMGYLLGALAMPRLLTRFGPAPLVLGGAVLASLFMGLSGFFTGAAPLLLQRLLAGVASALVFSAGGLLVARLAASEPQRGGFLIGLYYGGTGFGIVASALLVPAVLQAASAQPHGWAWAWWALAGVCVLACGVLLWPVRVLARLGESAKNAVGSQATSDAKLEFKPGRRFVWRDFSFALAGYALFGVGYIGYMTFVIALLREQGASGEAVTLFYALLGAAVVLSSRLWAGLLDRFKGGQALAILNALLGVATILPALTSSWPVVLVSGLLFGGVFLSVVASTTALVRHNLPPAAWAAGISAFTAVFAAGQIVGPTVVGMIADGPGGLARGLVFSAVALWVGAALAWRQRGL
jgi:predicted MFS family arabinose efflux permease